MMKEIYTCDLCKSEYDRYNAKYEHTTNFCGGFENYGTNWQSVVYKKGKANLYQRLFSWVSYRNEKNSCKDGKLNIENTDSKLFHIQHVCNECAEDIENYILSKVKGVE